MKLSTFKTQILRQRFGGIGMQGCMKAILNLSSVAGPVIRFLDCEAEPLEFAEVNANRPSTRFFKTKTFLSMSYGTTVFHVKAG